MNPPTNNKVDTLKPNTECWADKFLKVNLCNGNN